MPKFSIVIPTYNRLELLKECLESVWSQIYQDFEIIVVDDGSFDGTSEYLESISKKIRFATQLNSGPGSARNLGASMAEGDYIAFLDSDDLWFSYTLETIQKVIQDNVYIKVLQIAATYSPTPMGLNISYDSLRISKFQSILDASSVVSIMGSGATIIRGDVWRQSTGFIPDRVVGEDIAYMMQIAALGTYIKIDSPPLFYYRHHNENSIGSADLWADGALAVLREYQIGSFRVETKQKKELKRWVARDIAYRAIETLKRKEGWKRFPVLYLASFKLNFSSQNFSYLLKSPIRWALAVAGIWPKNIQS